MASAQSVSYSMTTWTECSTSSGTLVTEAPASLGGSGPPGAGVSGTITDTSTIISTYCPWCEEAHTTVFTTSWSIFCPTSLSTTSYVVTESTSGVATPTWGSGPDYVPQGYTAGVHTCTVCGSSPLVATLTYPATATSLPYVSTIVPAPALATPAPSGPGPAQGSVVSQISDGQPQAPARTGTVPAPEVSSSSGAPEAMPNMSPAASAAPEASTTVAPETPAPAAPGTPAPAAPDAPAPAASKAPAPAAPAPAGSYPSETSASPESPTSPETSAESETHSRKPKHSTAPLAAEMTAGAGSSSPISETTVGVGYGSSATPAGNATTASPWMPLYRGAAVANRVASYSSLMAAAVATLAFAL